MLPFCNQTELMFRASGGIPGMLGSYSGCPDENGVQYCVLFPTRVRWGNSRLLGYCLPSTCTLLDIARQVVLDPMLNGTFNYSKLMHGDGMNTSQVMDRLEQYINCAPRSSSFLELNVHNIVSWAIIGFIILLVVLATLYDYYWSITARSIPFEVVMMGADGAVVRVLQPPNVVLLENQSKTNESSPRRHGEDLRCTTEKKVTEKQKGSFSASVTAITQPLLVAVEQSEADEAGRQIEPAHSPRMGETEDESATSPKKRHILDPSSGIKRLEQAKKWCRPKKERARVNATLCEGRAFFRNSTRNCSGRTDECRNFWRRSQMCPTFVHF
ncbi:transmembrane protein NRF-6 [Trypanosoma cruzi]|nr:transmembrane protein NRF-6 [Trypanosoma cruzi]